MLKKNCGFTVIEVLVTLALLAILVSIAAPSFTQMIHAQQMRSASIDLALAFTTSRHEAIMRKKPVMIINQDGQWTNGWQIFVDQNANGIFDAGDLKLKTGEATARGVRITGNTPVSSYIRYTLSNPQKFSRKIS